MNAIIVFSLLLLPALALAHDDVGQGGYAHDLSHYIIFGAASLLAIIIGYRENRKERRNKLGK